MRSKMCGSMKGSPRPISIMCSAEVPASPTRRSKTSSVISALGCGCVSRGHMGQYRLHLAVVSTMYSTGSARSTARRARYPHSSFARFQALMLTLIVAAARKTASYRQRRVPWPRRRNAGQPSTTAIALQSRTPGGEYRSSRRRDHAGCDRERTRPPRYGERCLPDVSAHRRPGTSCGLRDRRSGVLRTPVRARPPHRGPGVYPFRPCRAPGRQERVSIRKYPPEPSGRSAFCRQPFTPPGNVLRLRLRAEKSPQALISRLAYQSLKTQADGLRIRGGAAGYLRFAEEFVVDIEGFLHPYHYAIKVWRFEPYGAVQPASVRATSGMVRSRSKELRENHYFGRFGTDRPPPYEESHGRRPFDARAEPACGNQPPSGRQAFGVGSSQRPTARGEPARRRRGDPPCGRTSSPALDGRQQTAHPRKPRGGDAQPGAGAGQAAAQT